MVKSGRVAIAELVSRGKEELVLIRPYRKGLVLHTMYHADEMRDFNQVPKGEKVNVSKQELELGIGLIDRLTPEEFNPKNYKDEYRIRVLASRTRRVKARRSRSQRRHRNGGGKVVDIMKPSSAAWKESRPRKPPRPR